MDAYPGREFNIEGNPFENLMPILKEIRPHQATFVPDAADQKTSDHGFEFNNPEVREKLAAVVARSTVLRLPRQSLHGSRTRIHPLG